MTDPNERARELLATEYDSAEQPEHANEIRKGRVTPLEKCALKAVAAALRSSRAPEDVTDTAWGICRDVAELPDRTSPEDWPEAMLVTVGELHAIILDRFATPISPSGRDVEHALQVFFEQTGLVELLCDIIDCNAEDVGHGTGQSINSVLQLLGPANDHAVAALTAIGMSPDRGAALSSAPALPEQEWCQHQYDNLPLDPYPDRVDVCLLCGHMRDEVQAAPTDAE